MRITRIVYKKRYNFVNIFETLYHCVTLGPSSSNQSTFSAVIRGCFSVQQSTSMCFAVLPSRNLVTRFPYKDFKLYLYIEYYVYIYF